MKTFDVFDERISPCPTTGCWLWLRAVHTQGYGVFGGLNRTTRYAHRAFWEAANGHIPKGLVIDHICRNRLCVNPDHMRVVTRRENNVHNSDSMAALWASRQSCHKCGAAFTRDDRGRRRCVPCVNERARTNAAARRKRTQPTTET